MNAFAPLELQSRAWLGIREFLLLQDAGAFAEAGKTELIDGEILTMNAQFQRHGYAKSLLHLAVAAGLKSIKSALVAMTETSVALSPFDMPEPDIVIARKPSSNTAIPLDAVALLIEVSDTTQRFDLGRKAMVYARSGVAEYWVADLDTMQVIRHWAPDAAGYAARDIVAIGDPVTCMTLDGLVVDTSELLELPKPD